MFLIPVYTYLHVGVLVMPLTCRLSFKCRIDLYILVVHVVFSASMPMSHGGLMVRASD